MKTMLLDLSEIVVRQGMRVHVDVDQPGVEDPDLVFQDPLRGRLTFEHGGDVLSIHGRLHTRLNVACARCLADVDYPLDMAVEEHFPIEDVLHPSRPRAAHEEWETQVSSVVYLEQGRPILDLDEMMRQLLISEIPIQVLCREDCAGLCPQCGANRNLSVCACREEPFTAPLKGLAALLHIDEDRA